MNKDDASAVGGGGSDEGQEAPAANRQLDDRDGAAEAGGRGAAAKDDLDGEERTQRASRMREENASRPDHDDAQQLGRRRSTLHKQQQQQQHTRFNGKKAMPPQPDASSKLEKMTREQVDRALVSRNNIREEDKKRLRGLWGGDGDYGYFPYKFDDAQYIESWQQAYRLLGPYIDCDHAKSENSHDSGNNEDGYDESQYACSRWSMWASYYDPNYQGNGYYEYMGDDPTGELDCHEDDTEWILIGVYRQELYQWYEQISKHLWAIDEYDYVVALAGLAYMTDADCFQIGYDEDGAELYAGVRPLPGADIMMGLYSDQKCIELNEDTALTYDDFGMSGYMQLGSKDDEDEGGDQYYQSQEWWQATQEYKLSNFNGVYEPFKACTLCMDYPTYQDGYFIGDYGTDDDDLINQCWKFYSHDSFQCNGDCVAMGSSQGTIMSIHYAGRKFGAGETSYALEDEEVEQGLVAFAHSDPVQRFASNAFIIVSGIVFVGTFLAFAVARSNAKTVETKESKKYVLMDDYYKDGSDGRRRRRSKSKSGSRRRSKSSSRRSSSGQGNDERRRSRSSSNRNNSNKIEGSRSRDSRSSSRRRTEGGASGERGQSTDADRERRRRERARRERARRAASGEGGEEGEKGDSFRGVSSRYDPPELTGSAAPAAEGSESKPRRRSRSSSRARASSRRHRDDF